MRKRVAMLNRSLIFLVCISMVGVTTLPASLLPCCCKFERVKILAEGVSTDCPLHKEGRSAFPQPPRERSCCSTQQAVEEPVQATCCSQQVVLQKACGKCRCLEQMQIVTLSGYTVGQVNIKTSAVPVATVTPSAFLAVGNHNACITPDSYSPKNDVILKTCTLLI